MSSTFVGSWPTVGPCYTILLLLLLLIIIIIIQLLGMSRLHHSLTHQYPITIGYVQVVYRPRSPLLPPSSSKLSIDRNSIYATTTTTTKAAHQCPNAQCNLILNC